MYIIQFQMWLGGDGIPMLCDVWRGFNVCALNFNEFPFFWLCLGAKIKPFSYNIQIAKHTPFRADALKQKMEIHMYA